MGGIVRVSGSVGDPNWPRQLLIHYLRFSITAGSGEGFALNPLHEIPLLRSFPKEIQASLSFPGLSQLPRQSETELHRPIRKL